MYYLPWGIQWHIQYTLYGKKGIEFYRLLVSISRALNCVYGQKWKWNRNCGNRGAHRTKRITNTERKMLNSADGRDGMAIKCLCYMLFMRMSWINGHCAWSVRSVFFLDDSHMNIKWLKVRIFFYWAYSSPFCSPSSPAVHNQHAHETYV